MQIKTKACIECGFFYLINHGVEQELLKQVFDESKRFFSLPLEEKMKLLHRENRGYTPLYAENLNPSSSSKGDSKESFYIGPLESISSHSNLNHWPSEAYMLYNGYMIPEVCRDKSKQPLVWEDVHHINGSTLHRVMSTGRERYSAFRIIRIMHGFLISFCFGLEYSLCVFFALHLHWAPRTPCLPSAIPNGLPEACLVKA
ncbi:hypothetical protein HYC85_026712 [Camellia sinensis]|uniref:Non-haem dioxygenase N-terminal domain-containing protein n=1 Tax=Camellia sinensis TaxID=4442 RepID=A0A7J7G4B1_CAMSI|nr:hypothetical protein HYC85_026712 [Camellia sinensis]